MAARLKDTQVAKAEADKQVNALQASTRLRGGATITANNSVRQSLAAVAIPGLDIRQDGEVIRIEIPADKLFLPGTAQLQTDGYRILDEVAAAVQRTLSAAADRHRRPHRRLAGRQLHRRPRCSPARRPRPSSSSSCSAAAFPRGSSPSWRWAKTIRSPPTAHPPAKPKTAASRSCVYPDTIDG